MHRVTNAVLIAACAVICASQPVDNCSAVLKPAPAEILFRVSDPPQALTIPCSTTEHVEGVSYTWEKNGQAFTPQPPHSVQAEEGNLLFPHPQPEDEGNYQCFAHIGQSTAITRLISVRRTYLDAPKVTTQRHTPIEKRPYKLDCNIPNAHPKPEITWEHQLENDDNVTNPAVNPRYTIGPDGNLYFASAEEEDASKNFVYVCLAKNAAVDKPVPLVRHYIEGLKNDSNGPNHDVVHQYTSGNTTVLYGQRLFLYCIYGASPLAYPDWYKDGTNVNNNPGDRVTRYNRSKGRRLLIREVWMEDEGNYTCIVDNEVGKPQNHTMHLTVVRSPEFLKAPQPIAPAKAGEDLVIPCQLAGTPAPQITWTRNALPFPQIGRYSISSKNQGNVTIADLTIKNVQASDNGYFGCHAVNQYGDVYAESLVHV